MVRSEDVDLAVALGVDALGFVFYPKSPRCVSVDEARALRQRLPSFVSAVGLFVNAPDEMVHQVVRGAGLDVIQLHGDESPASIERLAQASRRPIWRAIRMRSPDDLLSSVGLFGAAECLLLDSFSEGFGGSGHAFDWSWIPNPHPARLVLSGGLDAARVPAAIHGVRPFAVDVSSGIQTDDPRRKDHRRMEAFVAQVLQADASIAVQSGTS